MLVAEFFDQRQQHVHAALVRSNQDPPALQVAQLADDSCASSESRCSRSA
jgi:hypothetical protein